MKAQKVPSLWKKKTLLIGPPNSFKQHICCGQINLDTFLSPFSNSIGVISPIVV